MEESGKGITEFTELGSEYRAQRRAFNAECSESAEQGGSRRHHRTHRDTLREEGG
mgnify:CR=1 FL=1